MTGSSWRCARSSRPTTTRPSSCRSRAATSTSWTASSSSWPPRSPTPGLRGLVARFAGDADFRARLRILPATQEAHHAWAGGLLEHTVGVASLCREAAQLHPRLRTDILLASALLHDAGRVRELDRGPLFLPTAEGRLLGHVHLGLRMIEEQAGGLEPEVLAEVLHAVGSHHDARAARTAEASVLYHANQLDAAAAVRPVTTES